MPGWTYNPATFSYCLQVDHDFYHVVQAVDGTWRAFFVPDDFGRYRTDEAAMRAVEDHLARRA